MVWKNQPRIGDCCHTLRSGWNTERQSAEKKPNILVIMGDDVGWFNVGAYHRGIMSGKTPNLDKLASQGMLFTDYYAEASCTAGRANFITGELPVRTGLTTVARLEQMSGCQLRRPRSLAH